MGSLMSGLEEMAVVRGVTPGVRGGSRLLLTEGAFDIARANTVLYVPMPRVVAATVAVSLLTGAWGGAQISVKRPVAGGLLAFADAKDLAAAGAIVLSEEECLGLSEIAIVVTTGSSTAGSLAVVNVMVEEGK